MSKVVSPFADAKEAKGRKDRKEWADRLRAAADRIENDPTTEGYVLLVDQGANGHSWNLDGSASVTRLIGLLECQKFRLLQGLEEATDL